MLYETLVFFKFVQIRCLLQKLQILCKIIRNLSGKLIMPKQGHRGTKIRKRGCSSSSSTSSRIHNYRLNKRVILVGKNRVAGIGGSRSSTPVPTWRNTPLRSAIDSPKYSQSAKSTRPVSARQLAATLWGMNDIPSPRLSESNLELMKEQPKKKNGNKMASKREKMQTGWGFHSGAAGPLPPHLSDPSHSPTVSEKMDRSGTGSHRRRTPSISQRLRSANKNVGASDSISNASFMEVETRSRALTSSGSVSGCRNRLKDASNALTTSKELLKIINRIWAHADQPSSSMSLVSALHAELERARLQVNQFIQEYRSEKKEMNYLMKCFSEEKASWKSKEQQAIETAVESIAGELEMEQKSRHRLESLNKKLGKEIAEMKASFLKAVKELECEKRAREITEQVCDELARNINDDRAEAEMHKRESVKVQGEVEKGRERDKIEFSDKLCHERVQLKLSDAKHQIPGKNSALNKLRKQLEGFLGTKRDKRVENVAYLSKSNDVSNRNEPEHIEGVDNVIESKEDSAESDLHSIELTSDNNNNYTNKGYKWALASAVGRESLKLPVHDEIRSRNSVPEHVSRRTTSLQKSMSGGVEWGVQDSSYQNLGDGIDRAKFLLEKETQRRTYLDETLRHKSVKALKDHALSSSKSPLAREYHNPSQQKEQSSYLQAMNLKLRMADSRGENQSERRSKW